MELEDSQNKQKSNKKTLKNCDQKGRNENKEALRYLCGWAVVLKKKSIYILSLLLKTPVL